MVMLFTSRLYGSKAAQTPLLTFRGSALIGREGGNINFAGGIALGTVTLGDESDDRLVIAVIGRQSTATQMLNCNICGYAATIKQVLQSNASLYLAYALVPRNGRIFRIDASYDIAGMGSDPLVAVYTVVGLSSFDPIDVQSITAAIDTVRTVSIQTQPGGIVIAAAGNDVVAAQSCTWTGDQTVTERLDTASIREFTVADIANANDDTSNAITATFAAPSTTGIALIAASFR